MNKLKGMLVIAGLLVIGYIEGSDVQGFDIEPIGWVMLIMVTVAILSLAWALDRMEREQQIESQMVDDYSVARLRGEYPSHNEYWDR